MAMNNLSSVSNHSKKRMMPRRKIDEAETERHRGGQVDADPGSIRATENVAEGKAWACSKICLGMVEDTKSTQVVLCPPKQQKQKLPPLALPSDLSRAGLVKSRTMPNGPRPAIVDQGFPNIEHGREVDKRLAFQIRESGQHKAPMFYASPMGFGGKDHGAEPAPVVSRRSRC